MVNLPAFDSRSADLGWLLKNSQASDAEVCALLLDVFRGEMERMVSAFLRSPAAAISAVEESIIWAIANRRSYASEVSGKAWLFEHLLRECENRLPGSAPGQRVVDAFEPGAYSGSHYDELLQSLEKEHALFLILNYGHGFTPEEIAHILKLPIEQVQAGFRANRERLAEHQQSCPVCASSTGDLRMLETLLRRALPASVPVLELDEAYLQRWQTTILPRATHQQSARHSRSRLRQFIQAGLFLALLGIGWLFNGQLSSGKAPAFSAAKPGLPTATLRRAGIQPARANPAVLATLRPSTTTATAAIPPAAAGPSNLGAILQMANNSQNTWHSLWADVQITRYDIVQNGSISQQIIRKQIWISQPSFSRVITGLLDGLPSATYTITGGNINGQSFENGEPFADTTTQLVPDSDLQKLFAPENMFLSGGAFTTAGRDVVADRPAWVVEWSAPGKPVYRFWIDAQYGIILHRREYDGQDLKKIISDIVIDSITFDVPFPPAIFELPQYKGDRFAHDFSGAPEIPDLTSILANWSPPRTQPTSPGRLPSILSCARSPDGSQVAYTTPSSSPSGDTALKVFNASVAQAAIPVLPGGITSGDYAFAPDSQRLAFFGCEKASGFCGVFLLDTHSARLTRLAPVTYADYIFWKPDGRYLALVAEDDSSGVLAQKSTTNMLMNEVITLTQPWHFLVIDASSGLIVYKRAFAWSQMSVPPDSPTNAWDTPFKTQLAGPEGCSGIVGKR